MKKIGRNDSCPCGSGIKYKKCCLEKNNIEDQEQMILPEIASLIHMRCIFENKFDDGKTDINLKNLFDNMCLTHNININSKDFDSNIFFNTIEKYIEEIIIEICSKYSAYELFFWHRRIHPEKSGDFSSNTNFSSYELIKKVIFLFGTKKDVFSIVEMNNVEFFLPKSIQHINNDNVLSEKIPNIVVEILADIYKLEKLSLFYIHIRNSRRVVIKGGGITFDDKYGFTSVIHDKNLDYLITLFDNRNNSQNLLNTIGGYSRENKKGELLLISLQTNFDKNKQEYFKGLRFKNNETSNFFAQWVNINEYYKLIKDLNPIIILKYNFYIEELISILMYFSYTIGISLHILIDENADHKSFEYREAMHLLQRGYLLIKDDEEVMRGYFECFFSTFSELFPDIKRPPFKNFNAAFKFLFSKTNNYNSLENELLTCNIFHKITKDKIVVDCTSYHLVLKSFLEEFKSVNGELGNKISTDFEHKVNNEISAIFGIETLYHHGELKNELKQKKEIDASFIIEDVLYVIECKSLSVSQGSLLGEKGANSFRKKKIIEFIDEVEQKAAFLQRSKTLSKTIPLKVKYIVPLVMTSYAEYIWERTESLFLGKDLPRVITVDELKNLGKDEILKSVRNKSFTYKYSL